MYNRHRFDIYIFDEDYRLVPKSNKDYVDPNGKIDPLFEEAIKQQCRETYQPIIDAQPEPFINLQFLYDFINYDRFN